MLNNPPVMFEGVVFSKKRRKRGHVESEKLIMSIGVNKIG